jgi:hypothetical protein
MSEFTPQFPRTVAGTEWRAALSNSDLEAIAMRADHLYRNTGLSEEHRAKLLARYALIVEADALIEELGFVARQFSLQNDPGVRPSKLTKGGSGGDMIKIAAGFALRLSEWIKLLEDHYGVTAWREFGRVDRDDCFPDDPRHPKNAPLPVPDRNVVSLRNPNSQPVMVDDDAPEPGDDI